MPFLHLIECKSNVQELTSCKVTSSITSSDLQDSDSTNIISSLDISTVDLPVMSSTENISIIVPEVGEMSGNISLNSKNSKTADNQALCSCELDVCPLQNAADRLHCDFLRRSFEKLEPQELGLCHELWNRQLTDIEDMTNGELVSPSQAIEFGGVLGVVEPYGVVCYSNGHPSFFSGKNSVAPDYHILQAPAIESHRNLPDTPICRKKNLGYHYSQDNDYEISNAPSFGPLIPSSRSEKSTAFESNNMSATTDSASKEFARLSYGDMICPQSCVKCSSGNVLDSISNLLAAELTLSNINEDIYSSDAKQLLNITTDRKQQSGSGIRFSSFNSSSKLPCFYRGRHPCFRYLGIKGQSLEFCKRFLVMHRGIWLRPIFSAEAIWKSKEPFMSISETQPPSIFDIHHRHSGQESMCSQIPVICSPNGLSTQPPRFGDLLLWSHSISQPLGHVAIIVGLGSDYVLIAEQNYTFTKFKSEGTFTRRLKLRRETIHDGDSSRVLCTIDDHVENDKLIKEHSTLLGWMTPGVPPVSFHDHDIPDNYREVLSKGSVSRVDVRQKSDDNYLPWLNPEEFPYDFYLKRSLVIDHQIGPDAIAPDHFVPTGYYLFDYDMWLRFRKATYSLEKLAIETTRKILLHPDSNAILEDYFGIPPELHSMLAYSFWRMPALFGRFDFGFDGENIKMLEFNCDSSAALLECSDTQEKWAKYVGINAPSSGYFGKPLSFSTGSFLKAKVRRYFKMLRRHHSGRPRHNVIHFLVDNDDEEIYTALCTIECAEQAGFETKLCVGLTMFRVLSDVESSPITNIGFQGNENPAVSPSSELPTVHDNIMKPESEKMFPTAHSEVIGLDHETLSVRSNSLPSVEHGHSSDNVGIEFPSLFVPPPFPGKIQHPHIMDTDGLEVEFVWKTWSWDTVFRSYREAKESENSLPLHQNPPANLRITKDTELNVCKGGVGSIFSPHATSKTSTQKSFPTCIGERERGVPNNQEIINDCRCPPCQIHNGPYPKLYEILLNQHITVLEPLWKAVTGSKAILPFMYQLSPNHPNILPCSFAPLPEIVTYPYVQKPVNGRAGQNVSLCQPISENLAKEKLEQFLKTYSSIIPDISQSFGNSHATKERSIENNNSPMSQGLDPDTIKTGKTLNEMTVHNKENNFSKANNVGKQEDLVFDSQNIRNNAVFPENVNSSSKEFNDLEFETSGGRFSNSRVIYQKRINLQRFKEKYFPIFCGWVVGRQFGGIVVREDISRITKLDSMVIPARVLR